MHPAMDRASVFAGQIDDIPHPKDLIHCDSSSHSPVTRGWPIGQFGSQTPRWPIDR